MLISQQLHNLNDTYARRDSLTSSEKIALVYSRIELRNLIERLGGNLVFDALSNTYAVELSKQQGERK